MSNFVLYLIGTLIVAGGLAWAAFQLKIPNEWIGIGVIIIVGLGIMTGVSKTRQKEKPDTEK